MRTFVAALVWGTFVTAALAADPFDSPSADAPTRVFAVGPLQVNTSSHPDHPPFLLVDRDGHVRYGVTPSPDVELSRHVGGRVGIRGRGRENSATGVMHIRAERLTLLGEVDGGVRQAAYQQPIEGEVAPQYAPPVESYIPPVEPHAAPVITEWQGAGAVDAGVYQGGEALPGYYDPGYGAGYGIPTDAGAGYYGQEGACCGGAGGYGGDACCGGASGYGGGGCAPCPCGVRGRHWLRAEWLYWWADEMRIPPLVTTGPAVPGTGALGADGTEILLGDEGILGGGRSGYRLTGGWWLDCCNRFGVEADYFNLKSESGRFTASSDGSEVLTRPFSNINPRDPNTGELDPPAREDAELVSFPDVLSGTVTADASTRLEGGGIRFRANACCRDTSCPDPCGCGFGYGRSSRFDVLGGYRFMQLKDSLVIREDLTSLLTSDPGQFDIVDSFETRNEFHGVDIGMLWELQRNRITLELLGRMALGNTRQVVNIAGSTITTVPGSPVQTNEGGLLAQRTNIGRHARNEFSVIPELGCTLGYFLTPRLRATMGYTFLYWSRVVRPGEIIDLDVNPDLLPPEVVPFEGAERPRFVWHDTDYWAQGLSFGFDYRW